MPRTFTAKPIKASKGSQLIYKFNFVQELDGDDVLDDDPDPPTVVEYGSTGQLTIDSVGLNSEAYDDEFDENVAAYNAVTARIKLASATVDAGTYSVLVTAYTANGEIYEGVQEIHFK